MKIVSYEKPVTENEYRVDVLALKDATDNAQDGLAAEFEVPADKIGPAKRLIAEAAREADRTAKFVNQSEPNKGVIVLTVVLASKRKTPVRKPKPAEGAPTVEAEGDETAAE